MARLTDMLEPGETVRYRAAMPREAVWIVVLWAILVGGMAADKMYRYPLEEPGDILFVLGVFFLPAFIVPAAIGLAIMWPRFPAWAITDRRIIALGGLLRNRRQDIALAEIEEARFADQQLILEGGGRTLKIRAVRIPAHVLTRSLGRWFPDTGRPKLRLGRILEPGEAVLLRDPALRWALLPAAMVAFGGYMLVGGLWLLATGGEVDFFDISVGMDFILIAGWGIVDVRAHTFWGFMVTDRRLLRGLAHDPALYEEFPLAAVEAVPPATFGDRLFVTLRGQQVQLPAKGKAAAHIREAIEAAKGAA